MSKQQWKLLLCATAAVATLLTALFVAAWFRVDMAGNEMEIDLRSAAMCDPTGVCVSFPLSKLRGFYPIMGNAAFFTGIPVLVLIIIQCASRLVTGSASTAVTKVGYVLAGASTVAGFCAGYLFGPESAGIEGVAVITVTRTWAPAMFILGNMLALFALYLSSAEWLADDVGEYKPIKLDKLDTGRLPVTPLSVNRVPVPPSSPGRERLPDSLPLEGTRSRTPTGQQRPVDDVARRLTPSQQIGRVDDVARRLTPSQQIGRVDDVARRLTPSQPIHRVDDVPRRLTPSQPMRRVDDPAPRVTPSQQFRQVDDTGRSKTPTQPPAVARTSSPSGGVRARSASQQPLGIVEVDARPKSPSQPPFVARTTSPSGIAVDPVQRSRTSSSGPIDLAARLSAAAPHGAIEPLGMGDSPVEFSIRPPLPQAQPVPPDQIPIDPAAGLTIRKRTPSVANEPVSPVALAPPVAQAPPPAAELPLPEPVIPLSKQKTVDLPDSAFQPPIAIETPPESGLLIRKRSPSAVDEPGVTPAMPAIALEGVVEGLAELKDELSKPVAIAAPEAAKPEAEPAFPPYIQNKIKYAIVTADVSPTGVTGKREDGTTKHVEWDTIVGVIARRLPPEKPFEGATIVDVVSAAGATLRVAPWTKIRGGLPLGKDAVERARGFVNLVASQALGAKLDAATKLFADSNGQAAQLPTIATLATHDERLA